MIKHTFVTKKYFSMLARGAASSLVLTLLIMSDASIAGRFTGEEGVAGVTIFTPLYLLACFFALRLSYGIPSLYSKAMGEMEKEKADKIFGFGLFESIMSGGIFFILTLILGEQFIRHYALSEAVYQNAAVYFYWMKYVVLVLPIMSLLREMIYTDGDERLSNIITATEIYGNIILSAILCHSFGIAGLGLGSFISVYVAAILCITHFYKEDNTLRFNLYFSAKTFYDMAVCTLMDSGIYLCLCVLGVCLNRYVASQFGSEMIIIVAVILLVKELQLVFDCVGEAIAPLMNIYIEEKNYVGVRKLWGHANRTSLMGGVVLAVALEILAQTILKIYHITDPGLYSVAVSGVRIMAISLPVVSYLYLLTTYYFQRKKRWLGLIVIGLRDCVLAVPLAITMTQLFGVYGLFEGVTVAVVLSFFASIILVALIFGPKNYPLILQHIKREVESYLYEFTVNPEEIKKVKDEIATVLRKDGYDSDSIMHALLMFESTFMSIYEENEGAEVLAECSVVIKDGMLILTGRDDGKVIGMSEDSMDLYLLRAQAQKRLATQRIFSSKHMLNMMYNSSTFEIAMTKVGKEEESKPEQTNTALEEAKKKYIDLHLHLDGALTVDIVRRLAEMQSIDVPSDDESLKEMITVPDDNDNPEDFLKRLELPLSLLQTKEGIKEGVRLVCDNIMSQGMIYAEIRFAPQLHTKRGLSQEDAVVAALEGLKETELMANFILSCIRGEENDKENEETLRLTEKYLVEHGGVVALDLAGSEERAATEKYRSLFEKAKSLNIPFTIHAGETDGPQSVKCAVEFGAKRIGHGVRISGNEEVMSLVKEKGVTLEMCPTSNIQKQAVADMAKYPLKEFMDYGIKVTINTDDMGIEGVTMADELYLMENMYGMPPEDLKTLLYNAVDAAFTTEKVKNKLRDMIEV
ncbi:MAG: adenosine deaminase [Lachnospiraceae bacterium]|nr:adenosine deaminase [Lachnospiraceae bacterium]